VSLEKRLRYLEKAWRQRSAEQEEREQTERPAAAERRGSRREEPFAAQRGWEQAGRYTLRRQRRSPNPLSGIEISEYLMPPGYTPADLLFFDTETTGLSGGAGNSIFLIGTAWIDGDELVAEQIFLRDFPGESEFLKALARRLQRRSVFVSYNGRAFDAHILRTRFLMNRMEFSLEQHTDLLYWSRRLWRRSLPDCSLSTIEREILGIRRQLDVSGLEVPGIYLEYLRSGHSDRLEAVLEHNLQDVRTLAVLLVVINSILLSRERGNGTGGRSGADGAVRAASLGQGGSAEAAVQRADRTALGNFFLSRDEQWGVELLRRSFVAGDDTAGRALSLFYKRAGAWSEAVDLWKQMTQRRKSLFAAVELAKYFEHRERDARLAMEWVQNIFSWQLPLDPRVRGELNHRRRRLSKKMKRPGMGDASRS
jgi:uncharacterized protein YprB with RNaseH-like and TPR domain